MVEDIFFTDLDFQPRLVPMRSNRELSGYRLQPGAFVGEKTLEELKNSGTLQESDIQHIAQASEEVASLIARLGETGQTVADLAREAGISERTLQRHFKAMKLPKPEFWRLLGRARRAACALQSAQPLADIALTYGYSDQAHMTRDFARWFGATPENLRHQPALLKLISQPGLGNWTGEQISIR